VVRQVHAAVFPNAEWAEKLLQVNVHAWNAASNSWEAEPIGSSDRAVSGKLKLWQHSLVLSAAKGSERAKQWSKKASLPAGRYLVKVYVDANERLKREWQSALGESAFIELPMRDRIIRDLRQRNPLRNQQAGNRPQREQRRRSGHRNEVYIVEFGGQFENLQQARVVQGGRRRKRISPASLTLTVAASHSKIEITSRKSYSNHHRP
jgi:hypothetical protein